MMQYAIFTRPVVTIYDLPQTTKQSEAGLVSTIGDEGLYGRGLSGAHRPRRRDCRGSASLSPEVAEVVTFYGYHGFVRDALKFVSEDTLRDYLPQPLVLVGGAAPMCSACPRCRGCGCWNWSGAACSAACPSRPRRPRPTQAGPGWPCWMAAPAMSGTWRWSRCGLR